ncbi:kelch-like protein 10 isoform X1 [Paralichthys olivaceus]|uniref:kelch-like protein 10 isoform X1 n=2 Tax=Paralichthys olivaceus TaxID=8255 RepID=UPI0037523D78
MSLMLKGPTTREKFCDAVIEVEDVKFLIHRIILCNCSTFLQSLFENWPTQKTVELPVMSPKIMQLIIEFAYTNTVSVTVDNVQELMLAADLLNVTGIIQICSDFMAEELCPNNCIGIWQFTNVCFSSELQAKAFNYITDCFEEVIPCKEFLQLTVQELVIILGSNDLNVRVESTLFDAILRWIAHIPEKREGHITVLLSKVRLALTSKDYIMSNVMSNKLVKKTSECMKIVSSYLKLMTNNTPLSGSEISKSVAYHRLPKAILLAIGGWSKGHITSHVQAYDIRANIWTKIYNNMKRPRTNHGAAFLNGYVYCVGGANGGFSGRFEYLNSVCRLDLSKHIWQDVANMHCRRSSVTVTVLNGVIYAIGGRDERGPLQSAECYFPKTNQWKRIAIMNEQRSEASCTTLDGKIYICGGSHGNIALQTAEYYNPQTDQWTMINPMNNRRGGVAVIGFENQIYAFGGLDGQIRLRTGEVYNPRSNTWHAVSSMLTPRSNFCLAEIEGRIFAVGGRSVLCNNANVEYYDPKTDEWFEAMDERFSLRGQGCCVIHGIPNLADYTSPRYVPWILDMQVIKEDPEDKCELSF